MYSTSQRIESRWVRGAILFFVLATCVRVWMGPTEILERANAQIPDPAMQRKLALEEARRTNQLLAEIKQLLATKVFNVRIAGADKKAVAPSVPPDKGR